MKFEIDADESTRRITGIALFLLLAFGVYCVLSGLRETLIFLALASAIFLLFLMMPLSVEVGKGYLKVRRVLGSVTIECRPEKVERVEKPGSILIGTAGLFGWYGVFVLRGETALVYSRKNRNLVMIKAGRNYVFGVKDADAFEDAVRLFLVK